MNASPSDLALGTHLRQLREQAGLDAAVLARRLSLSTAQLQQLERGEHSLFYTPAIRQQALRKLLLHLGGDLSRLQAAESAPPPATRAAGALASSPPQPAKPSAPGPAVERSASRRLTVAGLALSALLFALAYAVGHGQPGTAPVLSGRAPAVAAESMASPPAVAGIQEAAASAPIEAAPAATEGDAALAPPACQSADAPRVRPPQASKAGDMVYVVSPVDLELCVIDGQGRPQQHRLEAGQGRSFYGPPPWQLHAKDLRKAQLYFQGWKVRLPQQVDDRVLLVERD